MRRVIITGLFLAMSASAQVLPVECTAGDCVNAVWGESCGSGGNCGSASQSSGCGGLGSGCCDCTRAFLTAEDFFAGAFDRKEPSLFVLGVIPEQMTKAGVRRDDVLWSFGTGERGPKRRVRSRVAIVGLTPERGPRVIRITVFRRSTGEWFKRTLR